MCCEWKGLRPEHTGARFVSGVRSEACAAAAVAPESATSDRARSRTDVALFVSECGDALGRGRRCVCVCVWRSVEQSSWMPSLRFPVRARRDLRASVSGVACGQAPE